MNLLLIIRDMPTKVILTLAFLLLSLSLWSQGWLVEYPFTMDYTSTSASNHNIIQTDIGDYVSIIAEQESLGGNPAISSSIIIKRYDEFGEQTWVDILSEDQLTANGVYAQYNPLGIIQVNDGGFITLYEYGGIYYLYKIDSFGDTVWTQTIPDGIFDPQHQLLNIIRFDNDELMLVGFNIEITGFPGFDHKLLLIGIDSEGDVTWTKEQVVGNTTGEEFIPQNIRKCSDGGFILTGKMDNTPNSTTCGVYKLDSSGDIQWNETFDNLQYPQILEVGSGSYILAGSDTESTNTSTIIKLDPNGSQEWITTNGQRFNQLVPTQGGFILASNESSPLLINDITLNYYNDQGTLQNTNLLQTDGDTETSIQHTDDLGHIALSSNRLTKLDQNGYVFTNFIEGNVFGDFNSNCSYESSSDLLIPGKIVLLENGSNTFMTTSDENGYYNMTIDTGTYQISLINLDDMWVDCQPNNGSFTVTEPYDSTYLDIGATPQEMCTDLHVDLSASELVRCFDSEYDIHYSNTGTIPADSAYIEIQLDSFLVFVGASIPYNDLGNNLYSFPIGELDPYEYGSFNIEVLVDCDSTILGQTHCSTAQIYPADYCPAPSANWDMSSISVIGECETDSISFRVKNGGTGNMSTPSDYQIIVDEIIMYQGQIAPLNAGEEEEIKVLASGSIHRMEIEQSPNHPGNSNPTVTVENCSNNGIIPDVFVSYYENDFDSNISVDCQDNVGSYDPNDKTGYPTGYGDENYIEVGQDIEYKIRFQNTGTAPARKVVIRDTLGIELDLSTLVIGAASHDFTWEILTGRILTFTFDDIMLPDSTSNEPESHGFVKFRINQIPNLDLGTVIYNNAGIYFDFNQPVITNTTFHTLGEDFIMMDLVSSTSSNIVEDEMILIAPNPMKDEAIVVIENANQGLDYSLELYNMQGQSILKDTNNQGTFTIRRQQLSPGMYLLRCCQDGQHIATRKLMVR